MAWLEVLGNIFCGLIIIQCLFYYVTTVYMFRRCHEDIFGIPAAEVPETAPIVAILGFCCFVFAAMLLRSMIQTDPSSLLFDSICLFHVALFTAFATNIPKQIVVPPLLTSLASTTLLSFHLFQHNDWMSPSNALYMLLIFIGAVGLLIVMISLHWKTREKLIKRVSKAEKKIEKARRWFFFSKGDTSAV